MRVRRARGGNVLGSAGQAKSRARKRRVSDVKGKKKGERRTHSLRKCSSASDKMKSRGQLYQQTKRQDATRTHDVDTVSRNLGEQLVRLLKVPTDLDLGLVDHGLDLDGRTGSDVLARELVERLVVLFDRCAARTKQGGTVSMRSCLNVGKKRHAHDSDVDDRLGRLARSLVVLDVNSTQRRADSKRSVEDVNTKDDRVSSSKDLEGLESTRPDGLGGGGSSLLVLDRLVVLHERVEEMVDDLGCKEVERTTASVQAREERW